ncbi:glycosyltransferase, partial [Exiguobacterium sp. B2(2022)]|uniref:glycosyltransferase n=1 Tax=Exiguobacterium sp. B2(2022) TaxID=2992755 RepID=UPI00237C210E
AADCFVFPSKREGLGMAALEAMAAGLPIITSNVHGINDYSVDGVTGFKCAPNDVKGFAQAIQTMRLDFKLAQKMGFNNMKTAKSYDVEQSNTEMRRIYKSIHPSEH